MTKKKQKSGVSLRDLSRAQLDDADVDGFIRELTSSSDRAAALVASTVVDNDIAGVLEMILVHKSKEQLENLLYSPQAPLSSFSSRIKMLYAIGIIEDAVMSSLDTIRNIRNTFAHSHKPISFETPAIAKECAKIPTTQARWPEGTSMSENRTRYLSYCVTLSAIMRERVPELWADRPNLWALLHVRS